MKLLIAAGGTGGHIYPGIAVARELLMRDPESEILFVGTARGLETKIVPESGFELALINSAGLKNVGAKGKIKGLTLLPKSFFEARKILKDFRPDVVVGAGGYVSGPVLITASLMRIPTMVMDSNALPGFTNRRLARFVNKAALTFEESLSFFGTKGTVIGNPVRKEFFEVRPKQRSDVFSILIFGGSQGARAINNSMTDALEHLKGLAGRLKIVHQTGESDLDQIREFYSRTEFADSDVRPFITDMMAEFEKADVVICRAGATTCAELAAAGKASVMIPLPTAADDHQRKNAESFVDAGASLMLVQSELSGASLAAVIRELIETPNAIDAMERAAKRLGKPDAAASAVDLISELAYGKKG